MWVKRGLYDELMRDAARLSAACDALALAREQVSQLRDQVEDERARANRAVDELLLAKGLSPVTPPNKADMRSTDEMFEEDPGAVEAMQKEIREHGLAAAFAEAAP